MSVRLTVTSAAVATLTIPTLTPTQLTATAPVVVAYSKQLRLNYFLGGCAECR